MSCFKTMITVSSSVLQLIVFQFHSVVNIGGYNLCRVSKSANVVLLKNYCLNCSRSFQLLNSLLLFIDGFMAGNYGLISVAMHLRRLLESYIQTGRNVDSRASEINLQMYCMSQRNKVLVSLSFLGRGVELKELHQMILELIKMTAKRGTNTLWWHSWGLRNPRL